MSRHRWQPSDDYWQKPAAAGRARLKCVFVGDQTVGKTSLVVSYTTNGYPAEYVPTAFDTYSVLVTIDNKPCQLQLCDTAGQDDFDSIRPLCYNHTDVFLVSFSVVSPRSFRRVRQKWLPEIRRAIGQQPGAMPPFILVGTQCDLRHDVKVLIELDANGEQPVSSDYARSMAKKLGAIAYIECSALTQKNLKELFDNAIMAGLRYQRSKPEQPQPHQARPRQQHAPPSQPQQQLHFLPSSPALRNPPPLISDAKLVAWRKSLTKLSAEEALKSDHQAGPSPRLIRRRRLNGPGPAPSYPSYYPCYQTPYGTTVTLGQPPAAPVSSQPPPPSHYRTPGTPLLGRKHPVAKLAPTLRSSSFFFLPSPTLSNRRPAVTTTAEPELPPAGSNSSSRSSSRNSLFPSPHRKSMLDLLHQVMSTSVTELRNVRNCSVFKRLASSLSSSSTSQAGPNRRRKAAGHCGSVSCSCSSSTGSRHSSGANHKKKLKDFYYYDSYDYEEIPEPDSAGTCCGRPASIWSCCLPF